MKFWAKVKFKGEKNAEHLIRTFFKEFNPKNSIVIRGKEAKVEIHFKNQPPMGIVEVINHCDVVELNFGKTLGEYSEDETDQVAEEETFEQIEQVIADEETSEQIEQVIADEETSEQTEQVATEEETSTQTVEPEKKRGRPATKKVDPTKIVNVLNLEELAKKATSFEHFVKLVGEWLEMDMRQNFFENLVIVSTEVNKVSWSEMKKALKNKGVFYSQWDRTWTVRQVSEKLKDYSVTMLPLLNILGQYKEYSFRREQYEENTCTEQVAKEVTTVEEVTTTEVEENTPKNRVKMECMPEIPLFEETLGSVDKTQPIEERVKYVLTAMGWKKMKDKEKQEVFEIANTAVRLGRMNFDIIFVRANIPMESSMRARMTFSKFINDFVREYDSDKKVKLLDFLKQLQKSVMYESEVEIFTDFID